MLKFSFKKTKTDDVEIAQNRDILTLSESTFSPEEVINEINVSLKETFKPIKDGDKLPCSSIEWTKHHVEKISKINNVEHGARLATELYHMLLYSQFAAEKLISENKSLKLRLEKSISGSKIPESEPAPKDIPTSQTDTLVEMKKMLESIKETTKVTCDTVKDMKKDYVLASAMDMKILKDEVIKISSTFEKVPKGSTLATNMDMKNCKQVIKNEMGTYANMLAKSSVKYGARAGNTEKQFQVANSRGVGVEYCPKKTVVISGHKDKSLNATRQMKTAMWKLFPNYGIILAYPTPVKGTLTYQFSTEQEADTVLKNWKPNNFGGDTKDPTKAFQRLSEKVYGVLKDTPLDWTNEEAKDIIEEKFEIDQCRRINSKGEKTHVMIIKFKTNMELKRAISEGLKHGNEKLNFEESYGKQRQIVRCYNCQVFGKHIAKLCPNKPKCQNCSGEHKREECRTTVIKCANCQGDHKADSPECNVFKTYRDKIRELKDGY